MGLRAWTQFRMELLERLVLQSVKFDASTYLSLGTLGDISKDLVYNSEQQIKQWGVCLDPIAQWQRQ